MAVSRRCLGCGLFFNGSFLMSDSFTALTASSSVGGSLPAESARQTPDWVFVLALFIVAFLVGFVAWLAIR